MSAGGWRRTLNPALFKPHTHSWPVGPGEQILSTMPLPSFSQTVTALWRNGESLLCPDKLITGWSILAQWNACSRASCACLWLITQRADMRFHFRFRLPASLRPLRCALPARRHLKWHFKDTFPSCLPPTSLLTRSQSAKISIRCSLPPTI